VRLAQTSLSNLFAPFFQPPRMPSPMKDRQHPDFLFVDDVIDSIKLEPLYRRPAHIGEPYSMEER
jgi:hypothetical protein